MNKIQISLNDILDIYSEICKKHKVEYYLGDDYTELRVIEDDSIYKYFEKEDYIENLKNKFFDTTFHSKKVSVCYIADLIMCIYKSRNYIAPFEEVEIKDEYMKFIGSFDF